MPHSRPEGGVGGAPITDILKPGALGEAPDGSDMDYGAGDGRIPPARRAVYQDGRPGDGGAARQEPRGPGTNSGKPRSIPVPTTRVGTCRHNRRHSDGGCGATLRQGRFGRDVLGQFTELAPEVWGGKWGAKADCRGLHGVAGKWAAPMGCLQGIDDRPAY